MLKNERLERIFQLAKHVETRNEIAKRQPNYKPPAKIKRKRRRRRVGPHCLWPRQPWTFREAYRCERLHDPCPPVGYQKNQVYPFDPPEPTHVVGSYCPYPYRKGVFYQVHVCSLPHRCVPWMITEYVCRFGAGVAIIVQSCRYCGRDIARTFRSKQQKRKDASDVFRSVWSRNALGRIDTWR